MSEKVEKIIKILDDKGIYFQGIDINPTFQYFKVFNSSTKIPFIIEENYGPYYSISEMIQPGEWLMEFRGGQVHFRYNFCQFLQSKGILNPRWEKTITKRLFRQDEVEYKKIFNHSLNVEENIELIQYFNNFINEYLRPIQCCCCCSKNKIKS